MKKIGLIVLALGLLIPMSAFSAELKIGYVDVLKVFNDYNKTKDYDKVLDEQRTEKEEGLEKKKEEIKAIQDKIELLKDEQKDEKREEITKAATEYREMERQSILDLKKQRDEKMKEIIDDINKVIEQYAKKNGYDIILNKGSVLSGAKGMDLTNEILKIVNKQYKKK
jgi:outer membrane protein